MEENRDSFGEQEVVRPGVQWPAIQSRNFVGVGRHQNLGQGRATECPRTDIFDERLRVTTEVGVKGGGTTALVSTFLFGRLMRVIKFLKSDSTLNFFFKAKLGVVLPSILLGTMLFVFVSTFYILLFAMVGEINIFQISSITKVKNLNEELFLSVFFAPLVESLMICFMHILVNKILKDGVLHFVLLTATLAFLSHVSRGMFALASFLAFSLFSYQYAILHRETGTAKALMGVTLTHAVNNFLAFVVPRAI